MVFFAAIILLLLLHSVVPFSSVSYRHVAVDRVHSLFALTVSVDELEKDLTPSERSITGVVRQCGPSVAFITSVFPDTANISGRRRQSKQDDDSSTDLPRGNSLGSGSGFVVAPGYICTNYHVIERAYTIQKNAEIAEHTFDGFISHDILNITKSVIKNKLPGVFDAESLPAVYVRISSSSRYQKCRIVDVNTDLDLAVLKIISDDDNDDKSSAVEDDNNNINDSNYTVTASKDFISFGSSSDLLVGQSVVAIGNPFGLQSTVTAGVVSAVNREFRAGTARTPANTPIRNVIQVSSKLCI
ncbi:MAG: S1-C subfamily serine protease [Bacillariaceae sp.]|jgi:S1-C subfamily serine protease